MKKSAYKIAYFGTHEFAANILEHLITLNIAEIKSVYTQPDKPFGRKQVLTSTPVKKIALINDIPCLQPKSLKKTKFDLKNIDFAIVAQYGLIIPELWLQSLPYGFINIHTSLLPKYRGASPIQSALINGDLKTGVTIMKMGKGLDTGPIIYQNQIKICQTDEFFTLEKKLLSLTKKILKNSLRGYLNGKLKPIDQDDNVAVLCGQFNKEDGEIDWLNSAESIYNLYRGLIAWPGIWTIWEGKRLKLLNIKLNTASIKPGLVKIIDNRLFIGTGQGSIEVLKLQLEGKKPLDTKRFINGFKKIDNSNLANI